MAVLALSLLGGCSKRLVLSPTPNMLPTVRLTSGPIDTTEVCHPRPGISCYSLMLHWVGFDPDGKVAYYRYVVDPPDQGDTTWIQTTEKEKRFTFESNTANGGRDSLTLLKGYHVIVVEAVDNHGAPGPSAYRAFFSWTTAPTVQINVPRPHGTSQLLVPPSVRFRWEGHDEDATNMNVRLPVRYKYLLLGPGNGESVVPGGIPAIIASHGSLLRRYYAPEFRAEDGWEAVSRDTTAVQFSNLLPGADYLFIVVAFDESGAYSPVFELSTNVLYFRVGYATAFGPVMSVFNDTFYYKYPGPGFNPSNEVRVEIPGGRRVTISWLATPPAGADIVAYRWMLDGDVFDDRARSDEVYDTRHWSTPAVNVTSATIGPFATGDHYFYAQAQDNTGLKALATVHFRSIEPAFNKPLLIVDDTRRSPDSFYADGTLKPAAGNWPAAAELDTFMYAVGGVPWRRAPEGMLSPQGILAGYNFDTLGTRTVTAEGTASLATLAQYRHVVWLGDFDSGRNASAFTYPIDPMPLLSYMTTPGKLNTLTAYLELGGEVWLVGGGGAMATTYKFNEPSNDIGNGSFIFSSLGGRTELAPGRFMYSAAHWQTEIRAVTSTSLSATSNVLRSLGRFTSHPGSYAGVPTTFDARTVSTDPLPPYRTDPFFYLRNYSCEYLNVPTAMIEPVQGDLTVDFAIDVFDDADPAAVPARWRSSDSLNTTVGTVPVASAPPDVAGHALRLTTQGGGASDGDFVRHVFGGPRDYSGVSSIHMSVRENDAGHAAAWRVRLFDVEGRSVSAPVPATGLPGTFAPVEVVESAWAHDAGSALGFDRLQVTGLALVLDHGGAATTTDFDAMRSITLASASVMDTLMGIRTSFAAGATPSPTMTVYYGHDLPRPFIYTGFAPWTFRRTQCRALFDFVLRDLWGLQRGSSAASATARQALPAARMAMAAAHHSTRSTAVAAPALPVRSARRPR